MIRLIRIYYKTLGGHTHTRWFAGKGTTSLGRCGELAMTNEEWSVLKETIDQGQLQGGHIEFVQE